MAVSAAAGDVAVVVGGGVVGVGVCSDAWLVAGGAADASVPAAVEPCLGLAQTR